MLVPFSLWVLLGSYCGFNVEVREPGLASYCSPHEEPLTNLHLRAVAPERRRQGDRGEDVIAAAESRA
jgi:hypothetical protein